MTQIGHLVAQELDTDSEVEEEINLDPSKSWMAEFDRYMNTHESIPDDMSTVHYILPTKICLSYIYLYSTFRFHIVMCLAQLGSPRPSKPSHSKPSFSGLCSRLWLAHSSGLSTQEPWAMALAAAFCGWILCIV